MKRIKKLLIGAISLLVLIAPTFSLFGCKKDQSLTFAKAYDMSAIAGIQILNTKVINDETVALTSKPQTIDQTQKDDIVSNLIIAQSVANNGITKTETVNSTREGYEFYYTIKATDYLGEEKTYDIGDVVVIDNFRGTVTEIGIRTTKIKDAGSDIKVINNSDIRTLVNMTGDLSIAISDVDIEYSESLERVEEVIAKNLAVIKEKIPTIIDGPFYKGVASLGTSGVKLRIVAKCKEDTKFQTQRDINRQIKLIFDENNINIPFTQIVVHEPTKKAPIKKNTGKTDKFVLEQNVLSGNIDDEDVNKN